MILVFREDGALTVANDLAEIQRQCPGIDVLSDVFRFYDENGDPLKPVFDDPVKQRHFLGFSWSVDPGRYHLEADPAFSQDPLWVAFVETQLLQSNERFPSIESLKAFLRERGAIVDQQPTPG